MAIAIVATLLGGMTVAYTQATRRAQWTGYQLAAQALAIQSIERARACVWDPSAVPPSNELTNLTLLNRSYSAGVLTGYSWTNLDIPVSGTNFVRATNYITVKLMNVTGNTNVQVQMIKVQTVWPFFWANVNRLYTNTISAYCAPDNHVL